MNNYVSKKVKILPNVSAKNVVNPTKYDYRKEYAKSVKDKAEIIRLHTREMMMSPMFNSGVLTGLCAQ
jgi:hypothetical protein